MSQHWMVFPIIIPLLSAMACVLIGRGGRPLKRGIGFVGILGTLGAAIYMLYQVSGGEVFVYQLGGWEIPYGIIFVLDRLSATMVLLTNVLGLFAYLYAINGADKKSPYFHFLFLMQITGVNGAFLTGDLFNLFVFFEILLLSAYVLVIYGGGEERAKAGLRYVFLNLVGSALFLISVGVIYGVVGTLNMADLAHAMGDVGKTDATLLRAASYLLLVVFSIKAAIFPLYFWLPKSYAAASAPVAALFAIMTKVGAYALLRSNTLFFGEGQGFVENLAHPYLLPLGLVTLTLGVISAMAATRLRSMAAYLLIASVGTILAGFGLFNADGISGALYYMVHSTLIMGAFFLIADLISEQRGPEADDKLTGGPRVRDPILIGMLFFVTTIAVAGLPPLTGFFGKVLILEAAIDTDWTLVMWATVLVTSFLTLIAMSRAGTALFWKTDDPLEGDYEPVTVRALPIVGLLACIIAMVVFAGPIVEFMDATAAQLTTPSIYIESVLGEAAR
jgi:multicomponent K+:H+ antiporter subunit D